MPTPTLGGDAHEHDPAVVGRGEALDETVGDETVDGTRGGRPVHPEPVGETAHRATVAMDEHVERIHLALLERIVRAEEVFAEAGGGRAPSEVDPGVADAERLDAVDRVTQVDLVRRRPAVFMSCRYWLAASHVR